MPKLEPILIGWIIFNLMGLIIGNAATASFLSKSADTKTRAIAHSLTSALSVLLVTLVAAVYYRVQWIDYARSVKR